MDVLKERQLTGRASRRPVEYNYTNADIHHDNPEPYDGYQFEYPLSWSSNQSTQKVIGIRRINYKPPSINLVVTFTVKTQDKGNIDVQIYLVFTDQNTFEECINRIVVELNNGLIDAETKVRCIANYNKDTGDVEIRFDDGSKYVPYNIVFAFGNDTGYNKSEERWADETFWHYKGEFLKLFNQAITKENVDSLYDFEHEDITSLQLRNVWNRDTFYCHASFSDSPKQIIGINHDFWAIPSVFYEHSDNSNDFNIYFTTDTVHRILPRNGVLLLQISYIFNYQTSLLNYA